MGDKRGVELGANKKEYSKLPVGSNKATDSNTIQYMKDVVRSCVESSGVTLMMGLLTIWALFSSDIKVALTEPDTDIIFLAIISIAFFLFVLEILLTSFYKEEYINLPSWAPRPNETFWQLWQRRLTFGSFYFWLDWIATLSLIFELTWMTGGGGTVGSSNSSGDGTAKSLAKASRLVRIVRMVRLVRIVKLYKYAQQAAELKRQGGQKKVAAEGDNESRVGAAMSELINRRVVILILVMLIVIPLLTVIPDDKQYRISTRMVHGFAKNYFLNNSAYQTALNESISYMKTSQRAVSWTIARNKAGADLYQEYSDTESLHKLRINEVWYETVNEPGAYVNVMFSTQYVAKQSSAFAMYLTIFIMFLLISGTYYFNKDVDALVINPIEKMVSLVQKISADPLGVEYKMLGESDGFIQGMETTLLLQTINKIGGLMRVGFGEAGASVIAKNLGESAGGRLNLMGGGTMIHSIFGFCDVRQFTDTTECLQEEVMLFVNRIGHILHSIVVQCAGAANKNIGDAFLLTWKLNDNLEPVASALLADQALIAFLKTLINLNRYQDFICNFSVAATARLYKRFPGYKVRIGAGLHVGWAVEGAIGSNRKIDVSYLSPHVNQTEFLESSTKAYGVPLLLSEPFVKLLSSEVQNKYIRQVDRVRRNDVEEPFGMYCYDCDISLEFQEDAKRKKVAPDPSNRRGSIAIRSLPAVEAAANRKESKGGKHEDVNDLEGGDGAAKRDEKWMPTIMIPSPYSLKIWEDDDELVMLRHLVDDKFRALWKDGIAGYIKGDWRKARDVFHETMKLSNGQDGPSKFLIEMIDEHGGEAPPDWHGYRQEGGGH